MAISLTGLVWFRPFIKKMIRWCGLVWFDGVNGLAPAGSSSAAVALSCGRRRRWGPPLRVMARGRQPARASRSPAVRLSEVSGAGGGRKRPVRRRHGGRLLHTPPAARPRIRDKGIERAWERGASWPATSTSTSPPPSPPPMGATSPPAWAPIERARPEWRGRPHPSPLPASADRRALRPEDSASVDRRQHPPTTVPCVRCVPCGRIWLV
jgi:hypothetical protein